MPLSEKQKRAREAAVRRLAMRLAARRMTAAEVQKHCKCSKSTAYGLLRAVRSYMAALGGKLVRVRGKRLPGKSGPATAVYAVEPPPRKREAGDRVCS